MLNSAQPGISTASSSLTLAMADAALPSLTALEKRRAERREQKKDKKKEGKGKGREKGKGKRKGEKAALDSPAPKPPHTPPAPHGLPRAPTAVRPGTGSGS